MDYQWQQVLVKVKSSPNIEHIHCSWTLSRGFSLLKVSGSIQKMALKTLWVKYIWMKKHITYLPMKMILSWQLFFFQCSSLWQVSQEVNFWHCSLSEGSRGANRKDLKVRALRRTPDRHSWTGLVRLIAWRRRTRISPSVAVVISGFCECDLSFRSDTVTVNKLISCRTRSPVFIMCPL